MILESIMQWLICRSDIACGGSGSSSDLVHQPLAVFSCPLPLAESSGEVKRAALV